jgi:manganese efflux pump family protein
VLPLLVGLILPLGLDTFAVSAAIGASGVSAGARARLSLVFASFEGGMPLIGLLLGASLGHELGDVAEFIAIGGLIGIGAYELLAHEADEDRRARSLVQARGLVLVAAGLAVSLDELAIGFVFGLLDVPLGPAIAAIALQALVVSQLGFTLGAAVGERLRESAERLSGILLVALGLLLFVARLIPNAAP